MQLMISTYSKASAIAEILSSIRWELNVTADDILDRATAEEIDFYYEKICR